MEGVEAKDILFGRVKGLGATKIFFIPSSEVQSYSSLIINNIF